jgi:low temperature requirement protein LtrA
VLWIISALLEVPERYWVWALALAVDFLTPWLAVKHSMKFPPDGTHFPERFGLFTIILLGEFVAAVMRGIESQEYWSFSAAATAFSSMAFAFVLRWWYLDVGQSALSVTFGANAMRFCFKSGTTLTCRCSWVSASPESALSA